ncbi:MAG: response regulator [Lachnospiraceae bacterium]|nr:response regulator [Lachnospiraceae bacterium]
MSAKILFIGESVNSYMITSIKGSLEQAGYDIATSDMGFTDTFLREVNPDIILLMAGDYIDENRDALNILQSFCLYTHKQIDIIGYKHEYLELMRILKTDVVKGSFERPLKVDEMIKQLEVHSFDALQVHARKHILLVDDSGASLRLIKGWLDKEYRVSVASSAAMAIGFLQENSPDLILLDYEMPICSGPQFFEMIRAEEKTANIPVIFLTSKDDAAAVKEVLALKPAGYLLKTSPPKVIIDSIANYFKKHR